MIKLERSMQNKWIFQKNTSSSQLIEAYLQVINDIQELNFAQIQQRLRERDAYTGRTPSGSLSTMGVRFSQMCFYMFGYKNSEQIFIPTQTTLNMLYNNSERDKNMLVNLFSIQFPHPYSTTPDNFKIYAGRLILKLLIEDKIGRKLYIDEFVWFLPFIETLDENIYEELVNSIVEYRKLSFSEKESLFIENNNDDLFANCFHEFKYYFTNIFKEFGVFQLIRDINHNDGHIFKFRHGNTKTFRNDSVINRGLAPGYVQLNPNLLEPAKKLVEKYSPFDEPTSLNSSNVFSKEEWIGDLYENEFIKYLAIVLPNYEAKSDVINALADMTYNSKYGSRDGKDFENSLKEVFELFREARNVELISGAGDTDLLCTMENSNNGANLYKVNIDAKTGTSANSLNPARLNRHLKKNNSKYCLVVAPRFSRGTVLDLENYPIAIIKAETLAKYLSKECLSNQDSMADFNQINEIISEHLGTDITQYVEKLTSSKYGIAI